MSGSLVSSNTTIKVTGTSGEINSGAGTTTYAPAATNEYWIVSGFNFNSGTGSFIIYGTGSTNGILSGSTANTFFNGGIYLGPGSSIKLTGSVNSFALITKFINTP